ncbi:MAG: hypothetical protein ACOYZ8_06225 [Chloroflexota bacterium]
MRKIIQLTLIAASFWTLGACAFTGGESLPTPLPPDYLPTVIALTAQSINATLMAGTPPTATPEPSATPLPSDTPTPRPTPTPTAIPPAPLGLIRVAAPGPMSFVASPLQLRMDVVSGESEIVRVALYGEDGRVLFDKLTRVRHFATGAYVTLEIPFEIRAVSELARLQVSTTDRAGRLEAVSSTYVNLISIGVSEINPPAPPFERVAIYNLKPEAVISGGTLAIKGAMWPVNTQPVIIELLDPQGKVISQRQLSIVGETYTSFTTTLPYEVTGRTLARLVVRQADDRMEGLVYLYSQLINLEP